MNNNNKDKRITFLLNVAVVVVALALFYVCVKYLLRWLLPFVIALLIALLIRRPIEFLVRKTGIKKKVVAPIITTLFVVIIVSLVVLVIARLVGELSGFISQVPEWFQSSSPAIMDKFNALLDNIMVNLPEDIANTIDSIMGQFSSYLQNIVSTIASGAVSGLAGFASSVPSVLVGIIIAAVATYYIAGKTDRIRPLLLRLIPERSIPATGELYSTFGRTISKMAKAYALIMLITFIELCIGLAILGVNYFYIIAAITAILDILPILGTGTVLIPWAVISLIIGDYSMGIGVAVLYILITVIRQIIEPNIVSKHIGLPSLATLIGMYLGLRIFGILGMFLLPMAFILVKSANDMGVIHLWRPAPEPQEPAKESRFIAALRRWLISVFNWFKKLFSALILKIKGLIKKDKG